MAKKTPKKHAATMAAKPSRKLVDAVDRELIESALAKRKAGKKPTREELRALLRLERTKEEADRWRFYSSIPKRHWATLSGRQHKILDEQAARYGVPVGGKEIDLAALATWLHGFLADNAVKLRAADPRDPLLAGDSTPALERYRTARAILAEMEIEQQSGQWIPRDVIHDGLTLFASIIRGIGLTLQRAKSLTGPEAHQILEEGLTEGEQVIEGFCGALRQGNAEGETDANTGTK
ncbi:MAG: hypothetical protein NTW96_25930 [Planctomycetia bacterium]|nr:hypothetical protein [Planctomycetia bacterium]